MIEVCGLTKQYGEVRAVEDLMFDVPPGKVPSFLSPNGGGDSTTLHAQSRPSQPRDLSGQRRAVLPVRPTAARGRRIARCRCRRLSEDGAVTYRRRRGGTEGRCAVGRGDQAGGGRRSHPATGYSLGCGSDWDSPAPALLDDLGVVMLAEPVSGLHVDGGWWVRLLVPGSANEGPTVLVSRQLRSELLAAVVSFPIRDTT